MSTTVWPLFGLQVVTPRLVLRVATDDELPAIVEQARTLGDDQRFFSNGWAARPDPEFTQGIAQWHWRARAEWRPEEWTLPLTVFIDGEPAGAQDLMTRRFPTLRTAETGSWLGRGFRGFGTEARAAALHLLFAGLDAEVATSAARHDNPASLRVSRKLGYEDNGVGRAEFGAAGEVDTQIRLRLTRARWQEHRRDDIEIVGLEPCLPLFRPAGHTVGE